MFNSLTKKFKGDQTPVKQKNDQEMEGFICPICMMSFKTPQLVQEHFDQNHNETESTTTESINNSLFSPATERKESIQNIQENFKDLKQSLDEEIWFNKELQKEIERLMNLLKEKEEESKISNDVLEKHLLQIHELESVRDILTEEIKKVRLSRDSLIGENKTIRSDFHVCEEKMLTLTENEKELQKIIAGQKIEYNIVKEELSSLKDSVDSSNRQITDLSEISVKNEANESLVKELEMKIEKIKADRDRDMLAWNEKCSSLSNTISQQLSDKTESENNHKMLILKLQEQIDLAQTENQRLKNNFESISKSLLETEDKLLKDKRSWAIDQETLGNALEKLNEISSESQKLKSNNQDLTLKIKTRESEIMQLQNSLSTKETELITISKIHKNLTEELENVQQLLSTEKSEKNLLQSQVQMTDAANLVMEQLQSEKKNMQEHINSLKKQFDEEINRHEIDLSAAKSEIQSQNEKIFDLNSSSAEKEEQIAELSEKNLEMTNNFEKHEKKLKLELTIRSEMEDKIVTLTRDLKSKDETIDSVTNNYNGLKNEFDKLTQKFSSEEERVKKELSDLNCQLASAQKDADTIELLNASIQSQNINIQSLENDVNAKNLELEHLTNNITNLEKEKENLLTEVNSNKETICELNKIIEDKNSEINSKSIETDDNRTTIENLNQQIARDSQLMVDHESQLSLCESKMAEFEQSLQQSRIEIESLQESLKDSNTEQEKLSEENLSLKLEIDIIKTNLLDKEDVVTTLVNQQQVTENQLTETHQALSELRIDFENVEKEKEKTINELFLSKNQIDNIQELYSQSVIEQNECKNKLGNVTVEFNNTKKCLLELEEKQKILQVEYAKELDSLKREETQLKNHVKTLTKNLNESSEHYKQEFLEAAEKEFSLNTQVSELQTNLENFKRSLQRTEEDLETEKNLRESERHNMMGKITQLSEQVNTFENMRIEFEQKLEIVETENIENKLRMEMANEEKEKLLEKIIQVENNLKKQTDLYSKKCKEFDQLQSAILDLGRENQSLQISKEKFTNRQWIGDIDAVECFTCRKPFSLTLRKHHCRNCGQVYCQDCSSKSACLAASRKPVRVCDACYIEVQSQRRNNSVSSSNITLQM